MRYFPEGVWQVAISSDKTLCWSDQTGRALSAKVENKKIPTSQKNLLTNRVKCVILNSKGEGKAVPQRERTTRVGKTFLNEPDRTVFLCAGYKCEPDHAG